MNIEKSALFKENMKSYQNGNVFYIVNQGGMASGKTYNIVDLLMLLCCTQKNLVITITGPNYPALKRGAIRDCQSIYNSSTIYPNMITPPNMNGCKCNKTGSVIEFCVFYNREVAKGSKRDILFINECTSFDYEIAFELMNRTKKKVFLDFNPNVRFWVHTKIQPLPDCKFIYSTHKANHFIPSTMHDKIEELKDTDPQRYRVYGLGECGVVEGIIYKNWSNIHINDYEELKDAKTVYGLDFGFQNDPTALIRVQYASGKMFLTELCYKTGMLNKDIAELIKRVATPYDIVVADSAEMKSIAEIRNNGIPNIIPCSKGKGSIVQGIDIVQTYHLCVDVESQNLVSELLNYRWQKDRLDKFINIPSGPDHLLDAMRYAINYLHKNKQPIQTNLTQF